MFDRKRIENDRETLESFGLDLSIGSGLEVQFAALDLLAECILDDLPDLGDHMIDMIPNGDAA